MLGIAYRAISGHLIRTAGLIMSDIESAYLAFDPGEETPINALLGHSITYRIAIGPREGQRVFTPKAAERDKLENLARYTATAGRRPPLSTGSRRPLIRSPA